MLSLRIRYSCSSSHLSWSLFLFSPVHSLSWPWLLQFHFFDSILRNSCECSKATGTRSRMDQLVGSAYRPAHLSSSVLHFPSASPLFSLSFSERAERPHSYVLLTRMDPIRLLLSEAPEYCSEGCIIRLSSFLLSSSPRTSRWSASFRSSAHSAAPLSSCSLSHSGISNSTPRSACSLRSEQSPHSSSRSPSHLSVSEHLATLCSY